MNRVRSTVLAVAALLVLASGAPAVAQVPTPESVLGFVPGTDRKLVEWPVLVDYYQQLAASTPRVQYRELGKTTNGAPFVALVISSEANMGRLEEIRRMNGRLADPRTITSEAERDRLIRDGKTIVLVTSSIHSTEVGGHLTPTILAYRLATEDSPDIRAIRDQTVTLLVPTLNPDGVNIVARWYNRTLNTPAEGSGPPELYHHFVGHDNNRDWYAFTQVETQMTVDSLHNAWHPQIVHDIHQMGSNGARIFFPPFLDPVEPNVDPLIVQGFNTLGTFMAWELTGQGKKGVVTYSTYDGWTPARAYQHHHAGVRVLSETASARLATPITVAFDELRPGRGFDPKVASVNFADPWPGGPWGLPNIVAYQTAGALALLKHAALNRRVWLENFYEIGKRAVDGWEGWPSAIVIPADQPNRIGLETALAIMHRGLVETHRAERSFTADGRTWPAGSYVIPLQQPYASFAKALMERQDYPDLRQYPGGPPRAPYDVTAHTLPLLMGFDVLFVEQPLDVPLSAPIDRPTPRDWYDALSTTESARPRSRIGMFRPYAASMDEGWTRWIFETWSIPYTSLYNADIRTGNLRSSYDAIVIPDMSGRTIERGLPDTYPAEYAGGIGSEGVAALRQFVEEGGSLVVLNNATAWAIEAFGLPIRNVVANLPSQEFYAPGTIFAIELDSQHPLAANMPANTAAWFQQSPVFEITDPGASIDIVARYPARADNVLLSGWVLGAEHLAGNAALLDAHVGRGHVVLFGFRPQYRGQTIATYPLFFNALTRR